MGRAAPFVDSLATISPDRVAEVLDGALRRGLDVTSEAYPYTAGMTNLASAFFSDGWQARNGSIDYGALQWQTRSPVSWLPTGSRRE